MSLVLTFRNHPRSVLDPSAPMDYITDLETRVALLEGLGIDRVVCIDFTHELSLMRASDFVTTLAKGLRMRGLVVGPDFALGHGREGDIPALERLGKELGFWIEVVEPFAVEEGIIKSRTIRSMLGQGQMDAVQRMLGRSFSLSGLVVTGDRRGKALGFPTANLSVGSHLSLPRNGIYATWALVGGKRYQSATNIGVRPTFAPSPRLVECFLMDFDDDLYGDKLTLEFACRLRDEIAFASVDALVEQMKRDVEQSRAILSGQGNAG